MIKLSPITKTVFCALIIIIVSAAIVSFLANKIEASAKKTFEKRSMLALLEERSENLLELRSNYDLVSSKLPLIKDMIPDERGMEKAVISLENLALKTNNNQVLVFETIDKAKPVGEKIKLLKFSIILTGNIDSFTLYMEELKKLPYFIEISGVTVKNSIGVFNSESRMDIEAIIYTR